jgi:hypothetical protein
VGNSDFWKCRIFNISSWRNVCIKLQGNWLEMVKVITVNHKCIIILKKTIMPKVKVLSTNFWQETKEKRGSFLDDNEITGTDHWKSENSSRT